MAKKLKPFLPNLQQEMDSCDVSEASIAVAANRSTRTIQNWFDGIGEPSYSQAKAIRDSLFPEMDIEYLFSETLTDRNGVERAPKAVA